MKLIIDTDPGVDDALAIALAHALDTVELCGLTTIFGNTFVAQSSRNARYLCDMLGLNCPVAEGADLPWGASGYTPSANVHGPEGFGAMAEVPQIGRNADEDAADFLIRMARAHPGDLTVCAIGPLTNIADALQRDPSFADNAAKLVIMGGAYAVPGNITPHAEANIFHDAAAADAVFASDLDIVMIGLDATMQTLLAPADFDAMARSAPQIGGFIRDISDFYLGFYRSVGVTNGCPMHDAAAVLACTNPERFTMTHAGLQVIAEGEMIGATVVDPTRKPVAIATAIDGGWAHQTVMQKIATLP